MSFCSACGSSISDSYSYCTKCGSKIENNTTRDSLYDISTHGGTLALMNDIKILNDYFSEKFLLISKLKGENKRLLKYRGKKSIIFLVLAILFTILSFIAIFTQGVPFAIGYFCVTAGPFYILFSVFIAKAKKTKTKILADIQRNAEIIESTTEEIVNEYFQYEASNYYPFDYFYEYAIDSIIKYLNQFRAESLKDAINLFETELHQRRLEAQQQQIIDTQKEILGQANQIAKAATATAVFSGISAYNSSKIKKNVSEINKKLTQ